MEPTPHGDAPPPAASASNLRHGQAGGRRRAFLLISQVFVPDPAAVGQHMADVAREMARRGYPVRVLTSARGYEDPAARYASRENYHGADVVRLPFASFGKKSILTRLVGTISFMGQILIRALLERDLGAIFFSTSPPLIGVVATFVAMLRRVPSAYWAMDLNPDQLIALKKIDVQSVTAHLLEGVNRLILRRATLVIALDRFMARRLNARPHVGDKVIVLPPWSHEDPPAAPPSAATAEASNPFRARHGLEGKFVVMYSGNHSPSNPLDTLLLAARRYQGDNGIRFLFVGGGLGKKQVEAFIRDAGLTNAISLPYQPLAELGHSLSAADVHVVSLGDEMVGILHPCKVYGAMAVGRPILYFGPSPSHVTDLISAHSIGRSIQHGDVNAACAAIDELRRLPPDALAALGATAMAAVAESLGRWHLCGRLCDALERSLYNRTPAGPLLGRADRNPDGRRENFEEFA